ncbi:hypothetical protein TSUD_266810 [Trifolium subterraneum]|uniref:FYVE-type domain-containing protein n=1 Tax=Trifolium subterraneum TaxID=3900 RepID=A0A2Z6NBA5_TRISU|nr:hypothetical protein TSUD_266810 [Trifolium subterraneum]
MFLWASTGGSYRVSASSTPINTSGKSDGDDIESRCDVYIWGEVFADGFPSKTDVLIPKLLESKLYLDVHNIASSAHHVAIVNKRGEVFTWGKESGGRLGHGIDKDFDKPKLVEFLEDVILDIVACGEFHTCAVSKSDDFFTWGDGAHNVGLLGHGNEASHWIPKSVNGFLDGLQVVSVACGTWHSALATSNGKLFTFGDGTFGVLGHGDQESVLYPKEVQLLSGLKTMKVACGVWHTAAIVDVVFQSDSNVSSWKLFTWGDGDKYQLGHGNKETCLKPTRVSPLIEYNFQQIACGHTMTVALTTSGHVFAMGSTENGQLGNPNSAGKVPTLVQGKLLGEFVEEISCGAHHVAVLTSKKELYTWGKGSNGRLGHGDTEDKKSPTLVVALKDRHIKYISCGSNFTSCICIPKSVTGTDQSVCFGCRQAFGITRRRHNCYNCGLVFCYTCSSNKAFNAALAPTFEKPHRVCDTCFTKLRVDTDDPSKFNGKTAPSHCSTTGREGLDQSNLRSTKTLFSSITEPVKYHEIRNNKPGTEYGTTSFMRASLVPSILQLKDIAFPSSLNSIQSGLKPSTPPSSSQSPTSPHTCRSSLPPPSDNPRISGVLINSLRRANYVLIQQVSDLQRQIRGLKQISGVKDVQLQKLHRKAKEAIAWAAVESSCHTESKEFIESTKHQLKEVTEKLPVDIPETNILSAIQTRAEDFLKEISESETSELESKQQEVESCLEKLVESLQQNAPDISTPPSGTFELQDHILKQNADVLGDDHCQDKGNILEEIKKPTLESKQQNSHDISTLHSETSELQDHRLEQNADVLGDDRCQDEGNILDEINKTTLESKPQNSHDISTPHSGTSELQDHRLDQNADVLGDDRCQDDGNILVEIKKPTLESKQQNSHDISTSHSGNFEPQDHRLEQNDDVLGDDRCQDEGNKPTSESKQQNSHDISTPHSGTFEPQDHRLEQNADVLGDDRCQDEGNIHGEINKPTLESKQQNSPDITTSDGDTDKIQVQPTLESKQQNSPDITTSGSDTSKLQVHIHEKIDKTARVDQSEGGINVRQENNGSTISSVGETLSPQNSANGSISPLDSSRDERLQEKQVFEKFESGVYVLVVLRDDGIKIFKRVKFR